VDILIILAIPLALSLAALFIKKTRTIESLNIAGYACALLFSIKLADSVALSKTPLNLWNFFCVDGLSAFFIFIVAFIDLACAVYAVSYLENDIADGLISPGKTGFYYFLFNIFSLSMFFVGAVNNLGLLWLAVEMTTLTSAFLVGFYNSKRSVEAAWKYIILCSVGITLALLGTILFYYTASVHGGIRTLNWTDMAAVASRLDPKILKVAFLFILIGYGTKAGLAPMHTWLPDAHSQAPTPVSALLSAVLLKTAIYAVLRFAMITGKALGTAYCSDLLLFFGILSLAVSAGFILVQKDIKRLLAYSSVEHIGIICVGLGIGGPLGLYGALLHVFNHAATKTLMFFSAGNIIKHYKTRNMHAMKGVLAAMPFTGFFALLGAFALAGSAPFSIFISELIILIAGFSAGRLWVCGLFLLFVAIIFGAVVHHFSKALFGRKPDNIAVRTEPLSVKLVFLALFAFMLFMGFKVPGFINRFINSAVAAMTGV
jgi:hydrogenase-4 component F